jgi:hypothetical protein
MDTNFMKRLGENEKRKYNNNNNNNNNNVKNFFSITSNEVK